MQHLLLVDDDHSFAKHLSEGLNGHFKISHTASPNLLLAPGESQGLDKYDLMLVDLRMPEMDGLSFLLQLREQRPRLPGQVILTEFDTGNNRISAYTHHVVDFIHKNIDKEELVIRIKNAIFLSQKSGRDHYFSDFFYDGDTLSYSFKGQPLDLTKTETQILRQLLLSKGASVHKESLMRQVWKNKKALPQTLRTHIFNLGLKLNDHGFQVSISTDRRVQLTQKKKKQNRQ